LNMIGTCSGVCTATSTPAENARSLPLITTAEIYGRSFTLSNACANSSICWKSKTFSGGCVNVIRAS